MKKSVLEIHEELVTYGEKTQSTEKLIEIIIGNEKKAKEIIENYETLEDALGKKNYETLLTAGLTKGEAQRLIAAIEIGKRIAASDTEVRNHITSPGDAAKFLMPRLRHGTHEEFLTILLNTKNRVIKTERIAEGSLTSAVVHPREVFASAIVNHAAAILVAHNHPSGDPYPSSEDRHLTTSLEEAGKTLGIPLMDHIVIGDGRVNWTKHIIRLKRRFFYENEDTVRTNHSM